MIHDSAPWKATLLQDAELLARWAVKRLSAVSAFETD